MLFSVKIRAEPEKNNNELTNQSTIYLFFGPEVCKNLELGHQ